MTLNPKNPQVQDARQLERSWSLSGAQRAPSGTLPRETTWDGKFEMACVFIYIYICIYLYMYMYMYKLS